MDELRADRWEGEEAAALAARWGAADVHLFARVGSTNEVARRLATSGAPDGTVVLAEEQTAGRGRAGRSWSSPPGRGLWLSLLLRPGSEGLPLLPLLTGLVAARALDPFLPGSPVAIKWPNDLLVDGRKLGGILAEASWEGGATRALVVGVGLNLLQERADFPAELREHATSVRIEAGTGPPRLEVADRLVPALLRRLRGGSELTAAELAELRERDALRGTLVAVTDPHSGAPVAEGAAEGIDADGALLLRDAAGTVHRVRSGTVRATGAAVEGR